MIRVCDALMGLGKTQAAITYINEHPDEKFIYITPYLDEANRIKQGCPQAHFIEPSNKISEYHFKKLQHTEALISEGRNITTTHQAFKMYTQETLDNIKKQGYTLIIDENVDVLEAFEYHSDDLKIAIDAGYVIEEDGTYYLKEDSYHGRILSEFFSLLRSRELIRLDNSDSEKLFFWSLPEKLITSFRDVFVLTYLFEGQSLYYFFQIKNIPYEYIGVQKTEDGIFRFGSCPGYTPDYVLHLKDKIHILDNYKLNLVGKNYHALSMNWFKTHEEEIEQLKRNISNCYKHIWDKSESTDRLWGTYNSARGKIRGKGYTKAFLSFNTKATNAYKSRKFLVYAANPFMNVNEKQFYQKYKIEVNEDTYALSIMIQWIWRSAIRDGKEIYVYIPSRRMRTLLINWLDEVSKGGVEAG